MRWFTGESTKYVRTHRPNVFAVVETALTLASPRYAP